MGIKVSQKNGYTMAARREGCDDASAADFIGAIDHAEPIVSQVEKLQKVIRRE
jgi:hypothetical protein